VDRFIDGEADYFKKQDEIHAAIKAFVDDKYGFKEVSIDLNPLDVRGRGIDGLYMTVVGTSAEAGDSGQVGRGNNVVGVIPLNRPMSSEAAAGKNPISHVGKIYNLLSYRLANRIHSEVSGFKEVYVWLLSTIGDPINNPSALSVQLIPKGGISKNHYDEVEDVIDDEFTKLPEFLKELADGTLTVC